MGTSELSAKVAAVIARVRKDGDAALLYYTRKYDGMGLSLKNIRVSAAEITAAEKRVSPALRSVIKTAAENIRRFHRHELKRLPRSWKTSHKGIETGQLFRAVESVGVYVPGGRFSYPSTVLMTVIPARVAGVERIRMVTPPGKLAPEVLFAAKTAGVDEIFRTGGPAAVAALAFGTKTITPVDMIIGPGNAYVNEAKRQVFGTTGIDALAGPSEVAVIADRGADPYAIIEDLQAQAEHDPDASAHLYITSAPLARRVRSLLDPVLGKQVSMAICTLDRAVELVNRLAPEHLELLVASPEKVTGRIRSAGAIFAGYQTPTAAGDYWAGPSHVLPTGRSARYASGLSVSSFIKRSSFIRMSPDALERDTGSIAAIARAEGLEHHARSAESRMKRSVGRRTE